MDNQKKPSIPTSLQECTQTGRIVAHLYDFAQKLEARSNLVFSIFLSVGIICTILEAVSLIDVNEDAILWTAFTSIVMWIIYSTIAWSLCRFTAMLINALASITENTKITANVALWEASKKEPVSTPAEQKQPQKQVEAPVAPAKPAAPKVETTFHGDGSWTCGKCGQTNLALRTPCWRCDQPK